MALYVYECQQCGHRVERIEWKEQGPPFECPACGWLHAMKRVLSPPAIHFLGADWASNDKGGGRRS